jgi:hypothetical protein
MKNAINFLNKFTNGKTVLAIFVFTQALYFYILLISIPNVSKYATGMKLLDLKIFGYSSEYARLLLSQLGVIGRNAYLTQQLPIDMLYPFFFAVSSAILLIYFLRKKYSLENKIYLLVFVPFLAGICDYLENLGIITMLLSYPNLDDFIIKISSAFTLAKSLLTTLTYLLLLIALAIFLRNKKNISKTT